MARVKLDKIDRKILRNLQKDGRMSNVDLAKDVGISAPPCLRRVRALEDQGLINGYHANINNRALGYGVTVFAHVKLENHSDKELKKFEEKIMKLDRVRECWMLTGDTDFLLKIVAKNWDDYQDFFNETLMAIDGVTGVRSSLSIRSSKELPGVPIDE